MFAFITLCAFLALGCLGNGSGEIIEGTALSYYDALIDVTFVESLELETTERSLPRCAGRCLRNPQCMTFTFTTLMSSGTCRLHSDRLDELSTTNVVSNTKVFHIAGRLPTTTTTTTIATTTTKPTWVYTACSTDNQCPASVNALCFSGKCLCTIGYYYSESTDVCVQTCAQADLTDNYMLYPNRAVFNNDISCAFNIDNPQNCLVSCNSNANCRTLEYSDTYGECCIQSATALTRFDTTNNYDYYHRHCV